MPSALPMPPASGPSCCWARAATCFEASPSAPTIKSCSVSMSSGSTTLGSILMADDLAAALDGDLDQTAAGLSVDLGVDESLLGSHQLLLHLLCLGEQRRHVGLASGLHDSPLASWYRLGFACVVRAVQSSKRRRRQANVAPCAYLIACVSGLPPCWEPSASSLPSPSHRPRRTRSRRPAASPA